MLHPVGPLPAPVYWRRRALALVGVIAVLTLLGTTLAGGDGTQAAGQPAGSGQPAASAGTATGSPVSPSPSGTPTITPPPLEQSGPADGGPGLGSGADPGTETTASPSPTPSPDKPRPCPDSAIRLTVKTFAPAYRVGAMPVIALTVQNVSTATCTRDLGAAQQEVLLYAGATRLWSSNDCYPGGTKDPQPLGPGDSASFSVTWSGLSSRPKCAGERVRVGAGSYLLLGRLGTLVSKRSPIRLT